MTILRKVLFCALLVTCSHSFGAEAADGGASNNKTGGFASVDDAMKGLTTEQRNDQIQIYHCPVTAICNKTFFDKTHLRSHLQSSIHFYTRKNCRHCGKKLALTTLRKIPHIDGSCAQPTQNKTGQFTTVQAASKAIKKKRKSAYKKQKTPYQCPLCDKTYNTERKAIAHLHSKTHFNTRVECPHCHQMMAVSTKDSPFHKTGGCAEDTK